MALHVFMFLLVVCLFLSLALLWRLDWFHVRPQQMNSERASLREEVASPDCSVANIQPDVGLERAGRILHHVPWEHHALCYPGQDGMQRWLGLGVIESLQRRNALAKEV